MPCAPTVSPATLAPNNLACQQQHARAVQRHDLRGKGGRGRRAARERERDQTDTKRHGHASHLPQGENEKEKGENRGEGGKTRGNTEFFA
eukprot:1084582-Rhodomonas_salina.3